MKKYILIIGLFLILSLNSVSATLQYQEDANETVCTGDWDVTYPCSNTYDGNWDTYGKEVFVNANVFFNYTKPIDVLNSSLWEVKDNLERTNITIRSDCWNQNPIQFKAISFADVSYVYWYCYNGSSFEIIRNGGGGADVIYEEAMVWDIQQ